MSKREFKVLEEGHKYSLPVYEIDGGLKRIEDTGTPDDPFQNQIISFVRGSTDSDDNVPKKRGTLHEHLLSMMIHDLKYKNSLVPSREGSLVITKLQEALHWMEERQKDRENRNVVGTYKN